MNLQSFCLLFLIFQLNTISASTSTKVKFLPGFTGPLPFELETGYVTVDESELFYFFVKSDRNPKDDPFMLWLTGGPACSSFSGLAYEIGPIRFNIVEYNGTLPTLMLNPNSWTKVANILFVDSPVGTGFSYPETPLASQVGDFFQIQQAAKFLRQWLMHHPEFLSNELYIGGDSYSGLIVPGVVQQISNENEATITPFINLRGYILGNALTDTNIDSNSKIPFAHGMGLISDELYESLKRNCKGEYHTVDSSNIECLNDLEAFDKCTSGIEGAFILMRQCPLVSPKPGNLFDKRRSLDQQSQPFIDPGPDLPTFDCFSYRYLLSYYWMNNQSVRKALNIKKRSIVEWIRCDHGINYTSEIKSSLHYHVKLSRKGYRSLVYSGDHDMVVPFVGTQVWIRSLNYSIVDDWRPWILHGQVGGYTRTYSNKMTFATIKGGGHTAPEYRPAECEAIFTRWIQYDPL